ncbi:MAG: hypothetical protein H6709_23470 [Kofleriaceae bacterium]|nr:hypothetical protein [Myxococcales bacterium]MCB9559136.1 hypothetical protein [Kofleriaceae bacterium]MCB9575046.1 hypothetical protein [Kofleriaceae bacterium]
MKHHLLGVAVTIGSGLVAARVATAEPLRQADRVHDFHTVDRLTPQTTFGFELGYEKWDSGGPFDPTILGFDVSGHYVSDQGFGGYLVVPMAYVSTPDVVVGPLVIQGDSEVAIGNLELGGMYARQVDRRLDIVAHLGVALPTADDTGPGALQAFAAVPRYGDLAQRWINSSWLRLGVSPMGTAGPIFWRADFGLDVMLTDDGGDGVDISPILRLNVAGGVDLGPADVSVELATNVVSNDDPNADDSASTFAIGARLDGQIQPGIALILPVGFDGLEDYLDLAVAFSLTGRM